MTSATDPHPHPTVSPDWAPPTATTAAPPPAPDDKAPRWSLPALLAILALAAVLYGWNLSGNSLNSFYSAAIYSGTQSWKAWFFGSLDAGNFITVDKPPFALMIMGLSCRIFGFGTWQMMAPEIGAALGTIWILHSSVKRVFGHAAAAVAALVLALTPITVAINRDNNPDTILVLLMVAGAALALRATRDDRLLPLIGSAVCFGLAFNTKMLQGYIALPAVFAVYVYASKLGWKKKVVNLALAAVALAVSSFWWAAAVSLVPADDRPYIGGSTDGSAWDLIMGYNGLGRVLGGEGNGGGGGGGGGGGTFAGTAGLGRMFNDVLGGQISWLIPFAGLAFVAGLVLCGRAARTDVTRAALLLWGGWLALHYLTFAMAEGTMHPYYTTALAPGIAALCGGGGVMLWRAFRGGDARWSWVLPAGLVVTAVWAIVLLRRATDWNTWLWPAIGALMAVAVVGLFVLRSASSGTRLRLLGASVVAAIVAALAGPTAYAASPAFGSSGGMMGGTNPTAGPSTGGGMGGPGGGGGGGRGGGNGGGPGGQTPGGTQAGGQAGGEFPGGGNGQQNPGGGAPSGAPSGQDGQNGQDGQDGQQGAAGGEFPGGGTAPGGGTGGGPGGGGGGGMGGGGGGGGGMGGADSQLVSYLEKNQDGAKWLIAVSNSQSAGQLILSSGKPVISMWGFTGSDQAMTLAKLKELVKKGELHYIQLGGGGMGGNSSLNQEITTWVQKNGTAVKESDYNSTSESESESTSETDTSSSSSSSSSNTSTVYRLDASDVS
ncbi:glycosyltransferase family 39 protein [Streptomyces sp. NPDC001858]